MKNTIDYIYQLSLKHMHGCDISGTNTWEKGMVNEVAVGSEFYWSLMKTHNSSCCKRMCQQMSESQICNMYTFHTMGKWWPRSGLCSFKIHQKLDGITDGQDQEKTGMLEIKKYHNRNSL